jgi:hypothetical protein
VSARLTPPPPPLQAWLALAAELGKSPPPAFQLRRSAGVKSAQARWFESCRHLLERSLQPALTRHTPAHHPQAVSEVFCWAREPMAVRKLAQRKDELFTDLLVRHKAGFDRCDRLCSRLPWPILSTRACML